jgi:hypothetical protein
MRKPGPLQRQFLDDEGQTVFEFALVLMLLMAFILFFVQFGLMLGFGNYVHYATFMSARAYMAAGASQADQKQRAKDVIIKMLKKSEGQAGFDKYPMIAKGTGGGGDAIPGMEIGDTHYNANDGDYSWLQGVRYTFRSRLFMLPMAGRPDTGGPKPEVNTGDSTPQSDVNSVVLVSESWLGREPTDQECQSVMSAKGWIYDNGC